MIVRHSSFAPLARAGARVLVLGSMPGAASLAARQYYAHPQNQFWPIIEEVFGIARTLPYAGRLRALGQHRVALWDVLESCVRPGSLDAAIEHATAIPNDIPGLLHAHRDIIRICCNGRIAFDTLSRHFGERLPQQYPHIQCVRLPSTSPAHASMGPARKLEIWRAAMAPALR